MSYPHVANLLYSTPWHMLPAVHDSFLAQFEGHSRSGELADFLKLQASVRSVAAASNASNVSDSSPGTGGGESRRVSRVGSLAVVTFDGPLSKRLGMMEMMCGGGSYLEITEILEALANDPSVEQILFALNSPGGVARGALECAQSVAEVAAVKPVTVYTDELLASAGYFIAAGATQIFAAPSADVGSISTRMTMLETVKRADLAGDRPVDLSTGKFKSTGSYGLEISAEQEAQARAWVADVDSQFKDFVLEHRGNKGLSLASLEGQHWNASFAPVGLIDGLSNSLQDVIDYLVLSASLTE